MLYEVITIFIMWREDLGNKIKEYLQETVIINVIGNHSKPESYTYQEWMDVMRHYKIAFIEP